MLNPLICKLEQFATLSDEDKQVLADAARDVRTFRRRQDIIEQGDRPDHVHLVVEGWAARYKVLAQGERPIMAFLIPGDFCDIQVTLLDQMDHAITALSACRVAFIPRETMERIMGGEQPRLARALWWSTLVDEAILREWLVNLGHRPADMRLAHFMCEMLIRSKAVGLTKDDGFDMPLTQEELGDTMGMSTVHVNRMVQELRGQGLIESKGKRVMVADLKRLMAFADFDPAYLHQHGRVQGA
jgi:CRP-like cAMP-binding protein